MSEKNETDTRSVICDGIDQARLARGEEKFVRSNFEGPGLEWNDVGMARILVTTYKDSQWTSPERSEAARLLGLFADELYRVAPPIGSPTMDAVLRECVSVLKVKGVDYTGESPDRLANFRGIAKVMGLPERQVWAIYFWKHVTAILSHAKRGKVESEHIAGRIVDAINYLLLYALIVDEEARETASEVSSAPLASQVPVED